MPNLCPIDSRNRDAVPHGSGSGGLVRFKARLGLSAAGRRCGRKVAAEKVALAWWLRRGTTVRFSWVGGRLGMGHYTQVTQAVSRMDRKPGHALRLLREKLLAIEDKATGKLC